MRALLVAAAVLAALTYPGVTAAQPREAHPFDGGFGLAVGLTRYQLKDRVLNPLRHDGTFPSLGLFHERRPGDTRRRFDFQLSFTPVASRYESSKKSFASNLRLAYRRAWPATRPLPDTELFLGPVAELSTHLTYFDNWDDSHFYWVTAYSLGADAILDLGRWEGRTLSVEVSVPVIALVSRPDSPILYKSVRGAFTSIVAKLHENMRLTSLHEHLAIDATVHYRRHADALLRGLFWQVTYVHNSMPRSANLDILRHFAGVTVVF